MLTDILLTTVFSDYKSFLVGLINLLIYKPATFTHLFMYILPKYTLCNIHVIYNLSITETSQAWGGFKAEMKNN